MNLMFPFLIGKVLTGYEILYIFISSFFLFPFLIGKVLTSREMAKETAIS